MKATSKLHGLIAIVKTIEQDELFDALVAHGGSYDFENEPLPPVVEFYNDGCGPQSGIVLSARIHQSSKGPSTPKDIRLNVTDNNSDTYEIEIDSVYPGFLEVLTKKIPQPTPSVEERLNKAVDLLQSVRGSGYWPYASPAPCSTEVKIKENIDRAVRSLETAITLHESMFTLHKRDCMKSPSVVITPSK